LLFERANFETFAKAAQEKARRLHKHFQEGADGEGTRVAARPTLFSSKGWFENFKPCFSWQKVQLIGISRPAACVMADGIPKLKRLMEVQRHKPRLGMLQGKRGVPLSRMDKVT
jgi:hypothetical protein